MFFCDDGWTLETPYLINTLIAQLCLLLITTREKQIWIRILLPASATCNRLRLSSQPSQSSSNVLFRTENNMACLKINLDKSLSSDLF